MVTASHPLDNQDDSLIHPHKVIDQLKTLLPGKIYLEGDADTIGVIILLGVCTVPQLLSWNRTWNDFEGMVI
jgi:hypothetical protein